MPFLGRCSVAEFSADGTRLALGSSLGSIEVWEVGTWRSCEVLRGQRAAVRGLAFSPDGSALAVGDEHGNLFVWELAELPIVAQLARFNGAVERPKWAPGGSWLAVRAEGALHVFHSGTPAMRKLLSLRDVGWSSERILDELDRIEELTPDQREELGRLVRARKEDAWRMYRIARDVLLDPRRTAEEYDDAARLARELDGRDLGLHGPLARALGELRAGSPEAAIDVAAEMLRFDEAPEREELYQAVRGLAIVRLDDRARLRAEFSAPAHRGVSRLEELRSLWAELDSHLAELSLATAEGL
ncbi:MAG: hypothetical protein AAF682_25370 [Planctomycetota bacterium]